MKDIFFIICFLFTISLIGQNSRIKITGKIESDSIPIENAHVINLNSKMGTVSNEKGYFEISAQLNDTVRISAISYKTRTIIIEELHIKTKSFAVKLQIKVNELDEVIVDKNQFTKGINATTLILPNAGKKPLDQNERKLNYYSQESVPIVILLTLIGQRGGIDDIYNIVSGNRKKHRKLKELLDQDKLFEFNQKEIEKIRIHFKDDFFINNLNLPREKINLFIEYCLPKNIIKYFDAKRHMEIIDVFIKEIDNFNLITSQLE